MTTRYPAGLAALAISALFVACTTDSEPHMLGIQANRFATSEWSEPVNLGPIVNSSANDANAALSPDEHALYFVSNRTGGVGGTDIWVSRRQCLRCPWETPVNPGAPVNPDAALVLQQSGRHLSGRRDERGHAPSPRRSRPRA